MTVGPEPPRVVTAEREIAAPAQRIFDLVADPAEQPRWDGNDNLAHAEAGQRIRAFGDVFRTTITKGSVRENHVAEFVEGRLVSWRPASPGEEPAGHLWRWEFVPLDAERTLVRHTYDWSQLRDPRRLERARSTTPEHLRASLDRLAGIAGHEE